MLPFLLWCFPAQRWRSDVCPSWQWEMGFHRCALSHRVDRKCYIVGGVQITAVCMLINLPFTRIQLYYTFSVRHTGKVESDQEQVTRIGSSLSLLQFLFLHSLQFMDDFSGNYTTTIDILPKQACWIPSQILLFIMWCGQAIWQYLIWQLAFLYILKQLISLIPHQYIVHPIM